MFDLRISGLDETRRMIASVTQRAGNLTPIADKVYDAVQSDVAQRFDSAPGVRASSTVYGGVEWPALTDAYIKAAKREGGKQLRISGNLESQFQRGGPGNVAEASGAAITFGAESGKAKGIQNKRAIIVAHPELIQEVGDLMAGYVAGRLTGL